MNIPEALAVLEQLLQVCQPLAKEASDPTGPGFFFADDVAIDMPSDLIVQCSAALTVLRSAFTHENPLTTAYEVLSISRRQLLALGFSKEQLALLSDEDMGRIAYWLENQFKDHGFEDYVKYIVTLELREKGWQEPEEVNNNEQNA